MTEEMTPKSRGDYYLWRANIENENNHLSYQIAQSHPKKNRYSTLFPHDKNIYAPGVEGGYLNASKITLGERSYIAAMGPLENTANDFWTAAVTGDSNTIVALVNPIEHGAQNCYPYWKDPIIKLPHGILSLDDKGIFKHQQVANEKTIEIRTFTWTPYEGNPKQIRHIHDSGWGDMDAPTATRLNYLLDIIGLENPHGMIVHCSAGIGRTGVFIATYDAAHEMLLIESQQECTMLSIDERIEIMNAQRPGMVMNYRQYLAIYAAIDARTKKQK